MSHNYSVGQLVRAAGAHFADRTSGICEVIRLMPESNGEFGYRIKNTASGTERAVGESQIRAVAVGQSIPAPASDEH
ncbi:hypothetical protein [Microvirga makkahensis]|uniref:Uncharacterized protein n=1 Tax=Microvirga makkahensis TaxID=1128670 RepID=A0A7X3SQB9_9HYPH|nr:hypothetical protein [Microvirga makkahensis]MXQ13113.1 hypothetical protein [Microvirga makkahensis]